MTTTPTDNLVRAFVAPDAAALRAGSNGDTGGRTLFGHFAVFNRWTEIDSAWEGQFLERIAPGAFKSAFTERRDQIKVLYDHGQDPQLGNKPLGTIAELREDDTGAYYEVDLIHASYNDDFVIPAARAGLLGASFRFRVAGEEWVEPTKATSHNPKNLPERTISSVDPLYEFGPVTFPAYAEGTQTGVRSLTDDYIDRLLHDPLVMARFTARAGLPAVEKLLAKLPPAAEPTETPTSSPPARSTDNPIDRPRLDARHRAELELVRERVAAATQGERR